MLHYAVNQPVGALRRGVDLAPILPWLRRICRWLEDRVRLKSGGAGFSLGGQSSARLRSELAERYRQPPNPAA